jgi:hypothetical protein
VHGYDIIGDVHGHAGVLKNLLVKLGYEYRSGVWRHQERQAIFVGDLIDRGPEQIETVRIVRSMLEAGSARCVMGNHEYNAIAYATCDPNRPGEYLRARSGERGERHGRQHRRFLEEVGVDSPLHREIVEWCRTLPLWLDLGAVRVVHACWEESSIAALTPHCVAGDVGVLSEDGFLATCEEGSDAWTAVEHSLKGPERELPPGEPYIDKDGNMRHSVRTAWWTEPAFLNLGEPLTFIGHYWQVGEMRPLSPRVICVDYSAGKGGPLVAYRWSGETEPDRANFTAAKT